MTQHIPGIGEHLIRYYGWYSNKNRGQRAKGQPAVAEKIEEKPLATGRKQGRKRWAALIKQVYEVDPLSCPKCGAEMKTCPAVALAEVDHRQGGGEVPGLWRSEEGVCAGAVPEVSARVARGVFVSWPVRSPSCLPAEASAKVDHQKQALENAVWVAEEVCAEVAH